jgi:hypothetical protein
MMICSISGLFADDVRIDRDLTPAIDIVTEVQDLGFDQGAAAFLRLQGQAGQKDLPDRKIAVGRLVTDQLDVILEEALRYLNVNAGAIAGLAVGIHRAAMPYGLERLDPLLDHAAARLAVDRCNEADTTGIMFFGDIETVGFGETPTIPPVILDEGSVLVLPAMFHGSASSRLLRASAQAAAADAWAPALRCR